MKVLINLLKFILITILTICLVAITFIYVADITVLDKSYIMQKLDETNFYSETYNLVESNFENYIYQSGLDEEVLQNICTQEKLKNDINIILSNIYDGTNQKIDTTEIADNLNDNIDELGIKNKQNESAIDEFVTHICDEYTDTVLHTKYESQINSKYEKIVSLSEKVYNIALIVSAVTLIILLIINNKKISKDIQHIGITLLATASFNFIICQIIVAKVNIQGIKILNDAFSNSLVTIIKDVLNKINSLAIGIGIIAIVFIAIYVSIVVNKKTKEI